MTQKEFRKQKCFDSQTKSNTELNYNSSALIYSMWWLVKTAADCLVRRKEVLNNFLNKISFPVSCVLVSAALVCTENVSKYNKYLLLPSPPPPYTHTHTHNH